jgi:hypothetical protein
VREIKERGIERRKIRVREEMFFKTSNNETLLISPFTNLLLMNELLKPFTIGTSLLKPS